MSLNQIRQCLNQQIFGRVVKLLFDVPKVLCLTFTTHIFQRYWSMIQLMLVRQTCFTHGRGFECSILNSLLTIATLASVGFSQLAPCQTRYIINTFFIAHDIFYTDFVYTQILILTSQCLLIFSS